MMNAVYLDCNATSPIEPAAADGVLHFIVEEFGNAGSRTHESGNKAKAAVGRAREHVADVVAADPSEVFFTSGATESDNLAILGLAEFGERTGRKHIISTAIEHKAVLEPLRALSRRGFTVDLVRPTVGGWVDPDDVFEALKPDTLLISVMHVNNETGVIQPIRSVAEGIRNHPAFFHVDAAQGYGKELDDLRDERIDMISVSGHKIYGPKGIGALVARRREFERPPLTPLMFGGGQERGLRPGTQPVELIVGLGIASKLATGERNTRYKANVSFRSRALQALAPLKPMMNGDGDRLVPHTVNISIPGVDAEAAMVALKGIIEVSNGSACTSASYEPSHVLRAMGLSEDRIRSALRLSWCHMTEEPDWGTVVEVLSALR